MSISSLQRLVFFADLTSEQLVKAFSAGGTVKTNYGKDYDKEFDEAGFCRVLAAALDSGQDEMDFFDAAKLAKERSR